MKPDCARADISLVPCGPQLRERAQRQNSSAYGTAISATTPTATAAT
jgi:hypothetical protein